MKRKILSILIMAVMSTTMFAGCRNENTNDKLVNNVVEENKIEKDTTYEEETTQNEEKSIQVGDEIKFGHYEQKGTLDYKEDIEWIVLDVKDDKIFVISKYALKLAPFHEYVTDKNVSWSNSTIRSWLNNDFFEIAFSNNERDVVCTTTLNTGDEDKVFLLSASEAKQYFDSDTERICDAIDGYGKDELLSNRVWWLRSPGENSGTIACVNGNGEIDYEGTAVANNGFNYNLSYANEWRVRPALWINSTMLKELMQSDEQDSTEKTYSKNEYLRKVLDAYLSYGIATYKEGFYFSFVHLDEDYFPELVIATDSHINWGSHTVYTYKDGKVTVTEYSEFKEFADKYSDCFYEDNFKYSNFDDIYDALDTFRDSTSSMVTPY